MKKLLLILCIFLLITGCKKEEEIVTPTDDIPEPVVEEYTDDNPVLVGLYKNGKLLNDISRPLANHQDIDVFDVYFTNDDDTGDTNTKRNFKKYLANYENPEQYKIGFYISFMVDDKLYEATYTNPDHMYKLTPYLYIYLYDDVHQADGSWYSHLEAKDVNEDTVYSSIKLYAAQEGAKINSPITLTVFTYDTDDDFDEDGKYRGKSMYTINITVK
jgi:hypothetical protein